MFCWASFVSIYFFKDYVERNLEDLSLRDSTIKLLLMHLKDMVIYSVTVAFITRYKIT